MSTVPDHDLVSVQLKAVVIAGPVVPYHKYCSYALYNFGIQIRAGPWFCLLKLVATYGPVVS